MRTGYLLHALAPLLRPTPARWGAFLDGEDRRTWARPGLARGGREPGPALGGRAPAAAEHRRAAALNLPVLILVAELGRQYDVRGLGGSARAVPRRVRTLPGVSQPPPGAHEQPDQLVADLWAFLD